MKTIKILITSALLWSGLAQSYELQDGTNVGELDEFLAMGHADKSKPEKEIAVFEDVGILLEYNGAKAEDVELFEVVDEEDPLSQDYWAFSLMSGPGHYIIKNANNDINVILFENKSSFEWGVISAEYLDIIGVGDEFVISHVTELNQIVSEPAAIALFALGAIGVFRRRQKKTNV